MFVLVLLSVEELTKLLARSGECFVSMTKLSVGAAKVAVEKLITIDYRGCGVDGGTFEKSDGMWKTSRTLAPLDPSGWGLVYKGEVPFLAEWGPCDVSAVANGCCDWGSYHSIPREIWMCISIAELQEKLNAQPRPAPTLASLVGRSA